MNEETHTDTVLPLLGQEAGEILRAAVSAAGGHLVAWRPLHVDCRPQRGTVAYRARVRWRGTRTPRTEILGAMVGHPLPEQVSVVGAGATRVGVWRLPHDPGLPGLRSATDPAAVSTVLCQLGGTITANPRLRLRSYRPGRRAVVEARFGTTRLFLKVLRPGRARALHDRHRLVADAGVPVPRSLGWTDDGVVVLTELAGNTLREHLHAASGPFPAATDLVQLLDRLPAGLRAMPARPTWPAQAHRHAANAGSVVPDRATQATDLARTIATDAVPGPEVPVHGDFYERQLITAGRSVRGVLDLDTVGPGDRLDDLACLVGHLCVLASVWPQHADPINDLAGEYLRSFERTADARQLRLRVAAVVLSLATGPHRVQEADWPQRVRDRLDLAERWAERANLPRPQQHPQPSP